MNPGAQELLAKDRKWDFKFVFILININFEQMFFMCLTRYQQHYYSKHIEYVHFCDILFIFFIYMHFLNKADPLAVKIVFLRRNLITSEEAKEFVICSKTHLAERHTES